MAAYQQFSIQYYGHIHDRDGRNSETSTYHANKEPSEDMTRCGVLSRAGHARAYLFHKVPFILFSFLLPSHSGLGQIVKIFRPRCPICKRPLTIPQLAFETTWPQFALDLICTWCHCYVKCIHTLSVYKLSWPRIHDLPYRQRRRRGATFTDASAVAPLGHFNSATVSDHTSDAPVPRAATGWGISFLFFNFFICLFFSW